jgi:ABC-type antimicrobial peptide transport system permease subunit
MAGLTYSVAEFNTIITMLGCLCATVQSYSGIYAAYYRKRTATLKTNDILFRAHRAFGSFATTLYFLGLFAGMVGFFGGIFFNNPPFEATNPSYNIHTWPSFAVIVVIVWKTYISYFKKPSVYRKGKWLGVATFIAWSYTWITAATSYYLRTLPSNPQHEPPTYLLPIELFWLQILIPFIVGSIIGYFVLRKAHKIELKKQEKLEIKI